ncbi:DUF2732 family protein [Pantoea sp. MQR6]|uniref:DUF2732 family protein n=1 Tax=Pantoea sp. MQR6 TaxID=2907307 RepID=UPI001FA94C07|nr:DUF2732 family protein [Pantoea sp. MQR6]
MRNIETHRFEADELAMQNLLTAARNEERKDRALKFSVRLAALAVHIHKKGLNGVEAAELLRQEAERFEHESRELH